MKYYETVMTCKRSDDEWVYYSGYDVDAAFDAADEGVDCMYAVEIREFELAKPREEMSDDEYCEMYAQGYSVIGRFEA